MIPEEKIIIALDSSEIEQTRKLLSCLQGKNVWVKVGMELFYAHGARFIHEAKEQGLKVFLDLKLHDIPHTVCQGLKNLCKLPIDMVNVHAAGGSEMLKRASETVKTSESSPLLIAVTQLTSTTSGQMNAEQRVPGDILESVSHYALLAKKCGCDGVVSSPREVQAIKLICGPRFLTITPGIRPSGAEAQDQKRITTPLEALHLGTDFMVIGRPITLAQDPRRALEEILQGL